MLTCKENVNLFLIDAAWLVNHSENQRGCKLLLSLIEESRLNDDFILDLEYSIQQFIYAIGFVITPFSLCYEREKDHLYCWEQLWSDRALGEDMQDIYLAQSQWANDIWYKIDSFLINPQ